MPDTFSLQDADAFLGQPPTAQPGTPPSPQTAPGDTFSEQDANDFLDTSPKPAPHYIAGLKGAIPASTPERDNWVNFSSVGRVLSAFGQGAKEGWGTEPLGLDPTTEASLQKYGILPDVKKGQTGIVRALNEGVIRPLAAAIDAGSRGISAGFGGAEAGLYQAGTEIGGEGLGRDVATLFESESFRPHSVPRLPELQAARDAGVIGEPDAVWSGVAEPAAAPPEAATQANVNEAKEGAAANPETAPQPFKKFTPESPFPSDTSIGLFPPDVQPEAVPNDIHSYARALDPQTFNEYDALTQHQDALRQDIAARQDDLARNVEAQAPHQAEIADLQSRLEDATPRLAKKYQARLDALIPERDAFLADEDKTALIMRETPEMQALRQELLETDYRMRDLAPAVSDAYRRAGEKFPAVQEDAAGGQQDASSPVLAPTEPAGTSPKRASGCRIGARCSGIGG